MSEKPLERKKIRWPVHVRCPKLSLLGVAACDITEKGIFISSDNTIQEKDPKEGDHIMIHLFPQPLGQGVATTGVVEWSGYSNKHSTKGFGVQFDDSALIKKLMRDHGDRIGYGS
jgi:hypothetical protein